MRKNIVAGNWKMNKTLQEGIALAKEINASLSGKTQKCEVIVGTPFIHLASVCEEIKDSVIAVAAENCADKPSGAYTGEVSAAMVASTGAKYCIIGHSERRTYYGETYEILRLKVRLALENGLRPIFCIGETKRCSTGTTRRLRFRPGSRRIWQNSACIRTRMGYRYGTDCHFRPSTRDARIHTFVDNPKVRQRVV